jgi:hypothetical protein
MPNKTGQFYLENYIIRCYRMAQAAKICRPQRQRQRPADAKKTGSHEKIRGCDIIETRRDS